MSSAPRPRPKYYDLNLAHLPPPGLVSILHRVTGALLFFPVIPVLLYLLQASLASEEGYAYWRHFFSHPVLKLVLLAGVWLYAHHFFAGIRFLLLDLHLGITKEAARASALGVLVLGVAATLLIGWRLW
ncbi:MAG TPA: succinate dehydrogenase, cytochrome b556 subunit [Usitatibacter sp.]|nr:succinate dehydrogenase, cytochrome b556 subunit [Usitatibacter sp.]